MDAIESHAIIGDSRSAALVCRDGRIDWLCWPRFDSPALFAALLDEGRGGSFGITPTAAFRSERAYLEDTNVLETTFVTQGGRATLTDFMTVRSEDEKRRQLISEHELVRLVRCTAGSMEMAVRFEPRPLFGAAAPELAQRGPHDLRLVHGRFLYTLRSELPLAVDEAGVARGTMRLRAGESRRLVLSFDAEGPAVLPLLGPALDSALEQTVRFWRSWSGRSRYNGPFRPAVTRSLLALKLLTFAPSGAIIAAPTTSLPERLGGDLNWDYRFCWLRDAALTVRALLDLGYEEDAAAFVSWLLHSTRLSRPELHVLYDVYGRDPPRERILSRLGGHRGSRPVRVNNGATEQLQLDVYGEVIDAVAQIVGRGARLDRETQAMLRDFGRYVCDNWRRPDHGLWEPRQEPRAHTHSRVLCWVALDRLLQLGRAGVLSGVDEPRLAADARAIYEDIEGHGWSEALASYTQELGGDTVDASLLLMSWYGFSAATAPRMRATFRAIDRRLGAGRALLYRYEQSRAAGEGAFGICSFWAVLHLARAGNRQAAARLAALCELANDVGLYAEEIDPATGAALGNFPQAFTHVGLINAALAVDELERGHRRRRPGRRESAVSELPL